MVLIAGLFGSNMSVVPGSLIGTSVGLIILHRIKLPSSDTSALSSLIFEWQAIDTNSLSITIRSLGDFLRAIYRVDFSSSEYIYLSDFKALLHTQPDQHPVS